MISSTLCSSLEWVASFLGASSPKCPCHVYIDISTDISAHLLGGVSGIEVQIKAGSQITNHERSQDCHQNQLLGSGPRKINEPWRGLVNWGEVADSVDLGEHWCHGPPVHGNGSPSSHQAGKKGIWSFAELRLFQSDERQSKPLLNRATEENHA